MRERGSIFVCFIIGALLLMSGFVFAAHVITNSGGSSFNEDVSSFFNISVNNTDTLAGANISEVNITLPSGFTFTSGTNGTDAGTHTFSNTGTVLSWSNDGLVMNLSVHNFWFNATAVNPGDYNISVATTNITGTYYTNISVTINDISAPWVPNFVSPSLSDGGNYSLDSIYVNVSANDTGGTDTIIIYLFNSTQDQINSSSSSSGSESYFYNFTGLSEGLYYVNASSNDSAGNGFNYSSTLTIRLDTTAPTLAFAEVADTATTLNISITITESGSGIGSSCTTNRTGATVSGTGTTQYIYETGLTCGQTVYNYNVTCSDLAGNNVSAVTSSMGTAACSSSSSSSSGSSGTSTSSVFWTNTYNKDSKDFSEINNVTKLLKKKHRIKIEIDNEKHYIGVVDLDDESVTINVTSKPQQEIFQVGDIKKFEVSGDDYYDLSIELHDITINNKANLTVKYIHELLEVEEDTVTSNVTSEESTGTSIEEGGADSSEGGSLTWLWLTVIFLVLIGVGGYFVWKYFDKKKVMSGTKGMVKIKDKLKLKKSKPKFSKPKIFESKLGK